MQWFKENMMVVNPDKFSSIIIDRKNQQHNHTSIKVNGVNINSENSVIVLGLEIDCKLNSDKHAKKVLVR